ncbi:hypothetical protein D3C77_336180 [compost metagenome]
MKHKNSTFRSAEPTWANACVGDNGSPSYVEYARGFSKAANLLISTVLEDRSIQFTADLFVYPICFNMRHSVELRLKGAIASLQNLAALKQKRLDFNLKGTHDLYKIWSYFKTESIQIDDRFHYINQKIDTTILDIAEVDPTGQTFRYPYNTKSVKHLTDESNINIAVLERHFKKLEEGLDELLWLYDWLTDEYNHSNLKKIQRNKIFALANDLPPRSAWGDETFSSIKLQLREKHQLSSNQLTKAIRYIESNYSLASIIGIEKPLLGVTSDDIEELATIWIDDNADIKHLNTDNDILAASAASIALEELFNQRRTDWSALEKLATPEKTAGLHSLFYFAYDHKFTEYYERIHTHHLAKMQILATQENAAIKKQLKNIYHKANFLHHIIKSLFILGHSALAERIISNHGIEHAFSWISEARNGELSQYPDFAQYPKPGLPW